ncbi:MAG: hypothetical protein AAGC77_01875 [Pseudomonadota bacterium]
MDDPLHPITDFGEIPELVNIRAFFDGTDAIVECIPAKTLEKPFVPDTTAERKSETEKQIDSVLSGAFPIVESPNMLRLNFTFLRGFCAHEEFVEHPFFNDRLLGKRPDFSPLCEVAPSPWREFLPGYDGGDNPDVKHYRMLSMEIYVDILGVLEGGEWIKNEAAEIREVLQ